MASWAPTPRINERSTGDDTNFLQAAANVLAAALERTQAEEARRLQSDILQNIAEAVYLIRANDGVIVYTNPSFEQMFGYGPGELVGEHVSIVNAPTDKSPEETAKEVIAALDSTGVWRGEILNIKKDGTTFWCHANVSAFDHPEHGRVWATYHTDVTERKRLKEELREAREKLEGRVEREMLRKNPYGLTFREFTVLHYVAAGRADKEIAHGLGISPLTVHKHVANILAKMNAASRTEAAARALREGLVD